MNIENSLGAIEKIMKMNKNRAIEILDAYGADPAKWPKGERQGLQALLDMDQEGELDLYAAKALDDALAEDDAPLMPATLKATLLADVVDTLTVHPSTKLAEHSLDVSDRILGALKSFSEVHTVMRTAIMSGSVVAVLALGVWFGTSLSYEPLGEEDLYAAFGEDYGLWDEDPSTPSDNYGEKL
jgi:hypothetical protein